MGDEHPRGNCLSKNVSFCVRISDSVLCWDHNRCSCHSKRHLMSLLSVVIPDIKIEEKYDATRDDLISTGIHIIARDMVSANQC